MDWKERLQQNLVDYQSIPFWSWNDKLEPEELRRQIRAMKKAGIGGFFMHARGGLMTEYLGEDWFTATAACIDEAEKQGMHAWCYDENGWPSGFAGMKLLENRENWEHYIVCETKAAFDPNAMAVYAVENNHIRRLQAGESAKEYLCLYDRQNSSVVDILNPDIVAQFLAETHEKYYARFGADFGRAMQGFFTDEPQYFRWDTPYTPVILRAYSERYQGDLLDELGALFVDCEEAPRLRWRYWKLMNELYTTNFAKQIYDWCTAHNCQLTGHSIEERNLAGQMMCCAGIMPFYEYEHVPGIDWLGREIANECAPRQVSSAAQQLGKKHVITETFACAGWDVTPKELKRIAEWQYVNGVNQMCQHLYPYSIRGQRKRDYPAFYSEHNPWVKAEFRAFNDYFTALGCMLADSREEAPVAIVHPIHAAYLTYKHNDPHSVEALDARFAALVERFGAAGIGHHYVDESLLAEHGSVQGGKLKMGQCEYEYVVVPEMDTIDASTAKLLREYLAGGGKLFLQGKAPTLVEGEAADLSFLQSNVSFEEMQRAVRVRIDRADTAIRYTTRMADQGDFVFAVNLAKDQTYSIQLRIRAKGAKVFDAMAREYRPAYFLRDGEEIVVPLTFAPGDSLILVLDDAAQSAAKPAEPGVAHALSLDANVVSCSENALTLDTASLSYDNVSYGSPLPVMAISDRLLRERTNHTVYLKYSFTIKTVPERIRLEAEKMNAKRAWFNGEEVRLSDPGTLDPAFVSLNLAGRAKSGVNELVLEIDYYQSKEVYDVFNGVYYEHSDGTESLINCLSYITDIEAVYVLGDFGAYTPSLTPGAKNTLLSPADFWIGPRKTSLALDQLAQSGYLFFGGQITFEKDFEATGAETLLTLGGRFAVAKVSLNGGAEETLMFANALDVAGKLQKGRNQMRVTLLSSYRNLLGPFHFAPDPEPYGVSPDTFTHYGHWDNGKCPGYAQDQYAFAPFGITSITLR